MSKPVAGVAIALRCIKVIRGISIPFVVDFISSNDEAFGDVVPMPAAPVDGKMFCPNENEKQKSAGTKHSRFTFFMMIFYPNLL